MSGDLHRPWHEDFFEGLWIEAQSESFDHEQTRELVDASQEALQLMPGARVLDVPCGDGRVAVELASRGFLVTGLERNEALLERAREKAREAEVELTLEQGDMWSLPSLGEFDAAVCLWSSLGYDSEEKDLAFLSALAAQLRPGGSFLLETHVAETLLPQWEDQGWRWAGDILVAERREYDAVAGRIETNWVLSGPTSREEKYSSLRLYHFRELAVLLERAGLTPGPAFGSPDLEPFELGSSRLLILAHKKDD